jgi:protease-4
MRRTVRKILAPLVAILLATLTGGCVFVSGEVNPFARRPRPLEEHVVSGAGKDKLVLINLSGEITDEEERAFGFQTRESTVARLQAELERAGADDRVRALIVRINSPGGTVTASDVLYNRLRQFRTERKVPIFVHLMDVAASGGFYVALAADEIVASPTTVTGSVGVVFTSVSVEGLLGKVGVTNQTIKTGDKKDIGSPLRAMTPEERELLESLLGEMQTRFLSLVRERRPRVTDDTQATIADGRVLSAAQALGYGLVDRIGYLEDTIDLAKKSAGLAKASIVMYRRPNEYAETIYSRANVSPAEANLFGLDLGARWRSPRFLYLWMP